MKEKNEWHGVQRLDGGKRSCPWRPDFSTNASASMATRLGSSQRLGHSHREEVVSGTYCSLLSFLSCFYNTLVSQKNLSTGRVINAAKSISHLAGNKSVYCSLARAPPGTDARHIIAAPTCGLTVITVRKSDHLAPSEKAAAVSACGVDYLTVTRREVKIRCLLSSCVRCRIQA